jgi:hypothetical protein
MLGQQPVAFPFIKLAMLTTTALAARDIEGQADTTFSGRKA